MTSFPAWPAPNFIQANGIRMAVYEAGTESSWPPVILCHGFPELAFSWRHQLRDLPQHGLRVIAPDQRGYGLTDATADIDSYDMEHLTADLIGLLDAKGIDRAVFVGHDWGGFVVWQMALRYPQRCAGVIGVNTPFTPRPQRDPIATMRERMGEDMYIVRFQPPGVADAILARDVANTLHFFMRRPPKGVTPVSAGFASERKGSGSIFPFVNMIAAYDPQRDTREKFLGDDEFNYFVETFSRTGFTGGINWYRNFTRNWAHSAHLPQLVQCPSLMIMADKDSVLPPSSADGMERFVPQLEKYLVRDCGHWTQQEKPDEMTATIADWMKRTFSARKTSS
jgi:pimeloyl-ACP methyl ester carboxylesterase